MLISIADDFTLKKIAHSGQCFRVREFGDGTFRFITGNEVLYIKQLSSQIFKVSCSDDMWKQIWISYFDLDRSYLQIRKAIPHSDEYMQRVANEGQGIRILHQDPWEALVTFIISQRKSIPAIKNSVEILANRFGETITTPYETVYTFPSVLQMAKASEQDLIDCKLGYRISYINDAITKVLSGSVDLSAISNLSDIEMLNALKAIRGVGDKIANCIGLFSYGRTGVAPIDTWIYKIIALEYNGVNPFPAYGDVAGIMQQYAFYYAISNKERFSGGNDHYIRQKLFRSKTSV